MTGRRSRTRREQGIALIWAILIMLIVFGTIAVAVGMTLVRTGETRDNANRTRSSLWMQAAADDLTQRLQSREIGHDLAAAAVDGQNLSVVVRPPGTMPPAPNISFRNGGTMAAQRIQFTADGRTHTGWYQVLPPAGTTTPWRATFRRNPTDPAQQGSMEMLVRAWEQGRQSEPVTARLSFRIASFSRFSLLADDRMVIGGMGQVRLGTYVHSNNSRVRPQAISILNGVNMSQARAITSSVGTISAPGCGTRCIANVRDIVEFGSGSRAMDRVAMLAARTAPINYAALGVARRVTGLQSGLTRMPVWLVDLQHGSCGTGVGFSRATMALRDDTVGVPMIDDLTPMQVTGFAGCLPVAEGGGAILFNGDVVVRGMRTSRHPVTIMARREPASPVSVLLDDDGIPTTAFRLSRVTMPASIFLLQTGNNVGVGSQSPYAPVGLLAEGGVYLPSWAMNSNALNRQMLVANVAAMATGAEVSYGPSIVAIASETGAADGLGLLPATAAAMGYGQGQNLEWRGSIASRRPIVFRYGASASGYVGYRNRNFSYVNELLWNPPPGFPSDRDWHLADYREFRQ